MQRPTLTPSFWFPFLVLCLLTGLSFWLQRATEVPLEHAPAQPNHTPDTLIDNFVLYRHDEAGFLRFRLSSPRMEHYPDDDSSVVDQPVLVQFRPDGPTTTLTGEMARVTEKGARIFVERKVRVVRDAFGKRPERAMETPELTVLPDDGRAFTDKPVRITEGKNWMHGVGMQADNLKGTFQLKSRVRALRLNPSPASKKRNAP
ncbi:MAG: LPS export ABC transporter periplasmic protein LptC [Zoogloeaceae bacterium]|jgi:lipopolysaccharide export system protein LptC|nr:LPS export ABC transporter periplasmic protein LptC [Zoogloeaceae bacterium]